MVYTIPLICFTSMGYYNYAYRVAMYTHKLCEENVILSCIAYMNVCSLKLQGLMNFEYLHYFLDTYIRLTIMDHYSLVWGNFYQKKWLILGQFELKESNIISERCPNSCNYETGCLLAMAVWYRSIL